MFHSYLEDSVPSIDNHYITQMVKCRFFLLNDRCFKFRHFLLFLLFFVAKIIQFCISTTIFWGNRYRAAFFLASIRNPSKRILPCAARCRKRLNGSAAGAGRGNSTTYRRDDLPGGV